MLDPVAQLPGDLVGHVDRILGDEIDADALGPDQPHDALDRVDQGRRGLVEQQMGLVEEEDQLGLVGVADLGKLLEQFGQQPEQEGGIELGARHQLVGGQDVDHPAPRIVGGDQVAQFERGFAEEMLAPCVRNWSSAR